MLLALQAFSIINRAYDQNALRSDQNESSMVEPCFEQESLGAI